MKKDKLNGIMEKFQDKQQALLPCLHFIQQEERKISEEVMNFLAEKLGIPRVEIYSVVSFYTMFSLET